MSKVILASSNLESLKPLEEALNNANISKDIFVRFDDRLTPCKAGIEINKSSPVSNSLCHCYVKEKLMDYGVPVLPFKTSFDKESTKPYVLKSAFDDIRTRFGTSFIVESSEDFRTLKSLLPKGYYLEELIKPTSEYRLFCTPTENFYAVKRYRMETEEGLCSSKDYTQKRLVKGGAIIFPKAWSKVQEACIRTVSLLRLDIAAVDVFYIASNHSFYINKVNLLPTMTSDVVAKYVTQIQKIVK